MAEKYRKFITGNNRLELIHISLDQTDNHAESWARKEQFPWPTILPSNCVTTKSGYFYDLLVAQKNGSIPNFILLGKDGSTIAHGTGYPDGEKLISRAIELTAGVP
ncbi:MAG: hypothetical protein P1V20_20330 [Verrucomicrobiales bacterium]|nr:hypothetical protein [Verrucomicrobiales bacterium]